MMHPTPLRGSRRSSTNTAKTAQRGPQASTCAIEPLENRLLMAFTANINFQPDASDVPNGYIKDAGHQIADRGNGLTYGWTGGNRNTPDRRNFNVRERNAHSDQLRDTLIKMGDYKWAIDVPNGTYQVHIVAGDPSTFGQNYRIRTEGVLTLNGTSTSDDRFVEGTATVAVTDGRMTISSPVGYDDNILNYVNITRIGGVNVASAAAAAVNTLTPMDDATVQDGAAASTNFGSSSSLVVKNHAAGYNREAFLKFDISGFSSGDSAVVRLHGRIADSTGTNLPVGLYPVSTATWSESTITWNNRPSAGSTAAATTKIPGSTAQWHEWNVTSHVQQQKVLGRTTVSFKLRAVNYYAARFVFNSSEAASNTPQMVVTAGEPTAGVSNIAAPTGLTATSASRTQINLRWIDGSSNETGFRIERRRGETGNFEQVALVGANVKTYSDTGLTEGYTYYYRTQAYNAGGASNYSNIQGAVNGPGATYDVRNYGAKLNGTANDAPAIQAAINAAKAAGGGTVLITGLAGIGSAKWIGLSVSNASNIVIAGMGTTAGFKVWATPSQRTSTFGGGTALDIQFSTNCTVQNLKFDGNKGSGVATILLGVERSSGMKLIGNKVFNSGNVSGALVAAGNLNNQYLRNEVYATSGSTRGMWIGNSNVDNKGNPFELETNPLIADNHIHDIAASGIVGHATGAHILNNVVERTAAAGITLGSSFDAPYTNAIIEGNICRNNATFGIQADGIWLDGNHPYVRAYTSGITIRNNILEGNGQSGIWAFYVDNWTITDNIIRNNGEHGIILQQARNVLVQNNTLYDTRPAGARTQNYGIHASAWAVVNGLQNVTITDNYSGQNRVMGLAIINLTRNTVTGTNTVVTGTADNLVISNNTFSDNAQYGLSITDEHVGDIRRVTVSGNVFLNNYTSNLSLGQKRIEPVDAPASLTLKSLSTSRVELTWTDSSNDESGYRIERKTGSGSWTTVATVGANVTRYENSGLSKGVKYTYRVRGLNAWGEVYLPSVERNITL